VATVRLFIYQAAELGPDNSLRVVCHERKFEAAAFEEAVVTANALHEVLHAAEHCNAIRVLDTNRNVLWSRLVRGLEQAA
jgi:hypothetical protein